MDLPVLQETMGVSVKKLLFLFLLLPALAWGQTRFYFSANPLGDVGATSRPIANFTAWSDTLSFGGAPLGYALKRVADGSASVGNVDDLDAGTTDSCLMMVFLSEPLVSQTISGTVKGQMRAEEDNTANNATIAFAVAVVSNNCDTLRGVLLNTSASDNTAATPPEFATTAVNRRFQDGSESASMTLASLSIYDGDRIAVYMGARETRNSSTATYTLYNGSPSATDLAEDDTDTDDDNPWIEFSATLSFPTDQPSQLPTPCGIHSGDYLWPVGDGQTNDMTACCASANWQNVDDSSYAKNDSNYVASTTMLWDWYKVRAKDVTAPAVWKRHNVNEQIDAVGVEAVVQLGHASSGTLTIELAMMDSINTQDTVFLGRWTTTTRNTPVVFSGYFWNIDSASRTGGNKWYNMKRPDSASLMGLQIGVGMNVNSTAGGRHGALYSVRAIVFTSLRDTTVADSVADAMQATACTTGSTVWTLHPYGIANSHLNNEEKFWLAAGSDSAAAANKAYVAGSNDTGKTWTYLDPDHVSLRPVGNDNVTNDPTGPMLVQDKTTGGAANADSLLWIWGAKDVGTSDQIWTGHTRDPSTTPGRWGTDGSGNPISSSDSGHVDSLTRTNSISVPVYSSAYQLADTIWLMTLQGAGLNSRTSLKWFRSTNNGVSWADSGYIHAKDAPRDHNPASDSISTTAARAWLVRWVDGYPALLSWGWARCSTSARNATEIMFHKWHPAVSDAGNADSIRLHAWLRNNNSATCDTSVLNTTAIVPNNNGQMVATSAYTGGDLSTVTAHVMWLGGSRVFHNYIDETLTRGTTPANPFVVYENGDNLNMGFTHLAISAMDTTIYAFASWFKNEASAGSDTNTNVFTIHCGGGKWRAPRPLFLVKPNALQFRYNTSAMYQYNAHRVLGAASRASARSTTARQAVVVNHIMRTGSYAAAAEGTTAPRRRRIIIQKNFKMGEADEKDTVPDWAGTDLPDWDAAEK